MGFNKAIIPKRIRKMNKLPEELNHEGVRSDAVKSALTNVKRRVVMDDILK
jgi:hypothetical protein